MSTTKLNTDLINNEIKEFEKSTKNQQLEKIQQMKSELKESMKDREDQEDPDDILYKNIERANRFLDILEDRITENDAPVNDDDDGNEKQKKHKKRKESTSRLFEVSAQLINAITTATQSIAGSYKDELDYQYKLELLEIKNKELMIKHALKGGEGGSNVTNNNLIVSSREEILDMIHNDENNSSE
ncbi:MAG: hypothetical protein ACOCQD_03555 [archaeon]